MPSPSSFGKTPESYLAGLRRKDSKHALTTCHGVTSNGRACRRPIASKGSVNDRYTIQGTILLPNNDEDPAIFYCWQHKDQADSLRTQDVKVVEVQERTSLETVFRNLGLEEVEEEPEAAPSPSPIARHEESGKPSGQRDTANNSIGRTPNVARVDFAPTTKKDSQPRRSREPRSRPKVEDTSRSPLPKTPSPHRSGLFSSLFSCFKEQQSPENDLQLPRPRNRRRHSDPALVGRHDAKLGGSSNVDRSENRPRKHSSSSSVPRETAISRKPIGSPNSRPDHARRKGGDLEKTESTQILAKDSSTPRYSPRRDSGVGESADRRKPHTRTSDPPKRRRASEQEPRRRKDTLDVYRDSAPTLSSNAPYLRPPFSHSESRQPLADRPYMDNRSKSTPERNQVSAEWMPAAPPNATDSMRICYAKLLMAMSEAPTKSDDEGYIYLFWQTEMEQTDAETTAAASIVDSNPVTQIAQEEILQRRFFQTSANANVPAAEERTVFLKIGRAGNVHQRLTQWQAQCGYSISLLRYYPHNAAEYSVKKVKYVGKVERLIHLNMEMLGKRIKKECRCGTEHKEWFEVGANPKEVREVDEIIRQWVAWSDDKFGTVNGPVKSS